MAKNDPAEEKVSEERVRDALVRVVALIDEGAEDSRAKELRLTAENGSLLVEKQILQANMEQLQEKMEALKIEGKDKDNKIAALETAAETQRRTLQQVSAAARTLALDADLGQTLRRGVAQAVQTSRPTLEFTFRFRQTDPRIDGAGILRGEVVQPLDVEPAVVDLDFLEDYLDQDSHFLL